MSENPPVLGRKSVCILCRFTTKSLHFKWPQCIIPRIMGGIVAGQSCFAGPETEWPLGWVLERAAGEVVGFIGNVPLAFQFRGRELRAATGIGWIVDKAYRGYSIPLPYQLLKQKDVDLFLSATVRPNAEPVLKFFKFARVPVGGSSVCFYPKCGKFMRGVALSLREWSG